MWKATRTLLLLVALAAPLAATAWTARADEPPVDPRVQQIYDVRDLGLSVDELAHRIRDASIQGLKVIWGDGALVVTGTSAEQDRFRAMLAEMRRETLATPGMEGVVGEDGKLVLGAKGETGSDPAVVRAHAEAAITKGQEWLLRQNQLHQNELQQRAAKAQDLQAQAEAARQQLADMQRRVQELIAAAEKAQDELAEAKQRAVAEAKRKEEYERALRALGGATGRDRATDTPFVAGGSQGDPVLAELQVLHDEVRALRGEVREIRALLTAQAEPGAAAPRPPRASK